VEKKQKKLTQWQEYSDMGAHAEKVYLIGSFNDWNENSTPPVNRNTSDY
jgi:hypothetical protein